MDPESTIEISGPEQQQYKLAPISNTVGASTPHYKRALRALGICATLTVLRSCKHTTSNMRCAAPQILLLYSVASGKHTWHSELVEGSAGNFSGRFRMLSKVLSRLLPLQPHSLTHAYSQSLCSNIRQLTHLVALCKIATSLASAVKPYLGGQGEV